MVIVVSEEPDSETIPESVSTDPSLLVVVQVVVYSVVTGGGKVVMVVNDDPDSDTIPESVSTDPSLLVVVQVVVYSV